MFQGRPAANRLPEGVKVASFSTYEAAQQAVNTLAEAEIDISGVALVGTDVRVVESVVGRLTWGRVAMAGAMRGLTFGLFLGIVFWLLVPEAGMVIIAMPVFGMAFGMLLSLITHSLTRKRRRFSSVQQVIPGSYDLIAPHGVAGAVMHKLGRGAPPVPAPQSQHPQVPNPQAQQPPASDGHSEQPPSNAGEPQQPDQPER